MKILLEWLQEYVEATESPAELARALTMAGVTVESVSGDGSATVFELEIGRAHV